MTARSAARTTSPSKVSRVNVLFLKQLSISSALPRGRHFYPTQNVYQKSPIMVITAALNVNDKLVRLCVSICGLTGVGQQTTFKFWYILKAIPGIL